MGLGCNGVTIRRATLEDAKKLARKLRAADVREIYRGSGRPPLVSLMTGVRETESYTAIDESGNPVMMFGISREDGLGIVWALGTDYVTQHPKTLQRLTVKVLENFSKGVDRLGGLIDPDNTTHVRWLQANGFTVEEPSVPVGPRSILFCPFYRYV